MSVGLREVLDADLPVFFEQQRDATAQRMAAFSPRDPEDLDAFMAHWARILGDASTVNRTIVLDGRVTGYVACFSHAGRREIGYWIGRESWGRGVATRALTSFLALLVERPVYAGVAKDNTASVRVLEKCGFIRCGEERGFSRVRGEEIDELVFVLHAGSGITNQEAG